MKKEQKDNEIKNNFEGYSKIIKNTPIKCEYCGKEHKADGHTIRFIRIMGDKNEPVCNIDCAIGLADKWEHMYAHMISDLRKRRMELEEEKEDKQKAKVK